MTGIVNTMEYLAGGPPVRMDALTARRIRLIAAFVWLALSSCHEDKGVPGASRPTAKEVVEVPAATVEHMPAVEELRSCRWGNFRAPVLNLAYDPTPFEGMLVAVLGRAANGRVGPIEVNASCASAPSPDECAQAPRADVALVMGILGRRAAAEEEESHHAIFQDLDGTLAFPQLLTASRCTSEPSSVAEQRRWPGESRRIAVGAFVAAIETEEQRDAINGHLVEVHGVLPKTKLATLLGIELSGSSPRAVPGVAVGLLIGDPSRPRKYPPGTSQPPTGSGPRFTLYTSLRGAIAPLVPVSDSGPFAMRWSFAEIMTDAKEAPTWATEGYAKLPLAKCRANIGSEVPWVHCVAHSVAAGSALMLSTATSCMGHGCDYRQWLGTPLIDELRFLGRSSAQSHHERDGIEVMPDHRTLLRSEGSPERPAEGDKRAATRAIDLISGNETPFSEYFSCRLSPGAHWLLCRDSNYDVLKVDLKGRFRSVVARARVPADQLVLRGVMDDYPSHVRFPSRDKLTFEVLVHEGSPLFEDTGGYLVRTVRWRE
jgi:hypothetical protein